MILEEAAINEDLTMSSSSRTNEIFQEKEDIYLKKTGFLSRFIQKGSLTALDQNVAPRTASSQPR